MTRAEDSKEGAFLVAQCQESMCQFRRPGFDPWVGKILWKRTWPPTPVLLPGKSHGQRSLVGYSPWGCKELDTIERLNNSIGTTRAASCRRRQRLGSTLNTARKSENC